MTLDSFSHSLPPYIYLPLFVFCLHLYWLPIRIAFSQPPSLYSCLRYIAPIPMHTHTFLLAHITSSQVSCLAFGLPIYNHLTRLRTVKPIVITPSIAVLCDWTELLDWPVAWTLARVCGQTCTPVPLYVPYTLHNRNFAFDQTSFTNHLDAVVQNEVDLSLSWIRSEQGRRSRIS